MLAHKLRRASGGGGAFPVVEATNTGFSNSQVSSHSVPLPSGIQSGDLLLIILAFQHNGGGDWNLPTGWTALYTQDNGAGIGQQVCYYREADGSEGATQTVTTNVVGRAGYNSYRISGYQGAPEAATTPDSGASTSPNPPSLTPSWGAAKTLWIATTSQDHNNQPSAIPTNYGDTINGTGTTSVGATMSSCRRELEATNDNPGAFTITSNRWVAATIAIRPA